MLISYIFNKRSAFKFVIGGGGVLSENNISSSLKL